MNANHETTGIRVTDARSDKTATAQKVSDLAPYNGAPRARYEVRDGQGVVLGTVTSSKDGHGETWWAVDATGREYDGLWRAVRSMAGIANVGSVTRISATCHVCGKPATGTVQDVNAGSEEVPVCSDECGDIATAHAPDCDCSDCEEERVEVLKAAALAVDPSGDLLVCDNTAPTDGPSYSLEMLLDGPIGYVGLITGGTMWSAETYEGGNVDGLPDAESAVRWVVEHQA